MSEQATEKTQPINPWIHAVEVAAADLNAVVARRRWWNWLRHLGHEEGRRYRYALLYAALWELDHPPERKQD